MPSSFLPLFQWADGSWLSLEIRSSRWQFAVLEMIHLVGLTIFLGSLVLIDLRLFGFGVRGMRPAELARDLWRWSRIGMVTVLGSGVVLFFGEPMKLYGSPAFFVKMVFLVAAILVQVTLFRQVRSQKANPESLADTVIGTLLLALWLGVGLAGRGIGFL
ncbi:MAG: hypothetical protein C5B51_30460 [Terriglobia bacterium]|nr:MAG: hypothetical protein C5B51_30460 [Terriglobia bacterium]